MLAHSEAMTCIYSELPLQQDNYSLDHFLPWRFVTHDLLWNLIPVPKMVNSSKSDNLPDHSYLEPFALQQYRAVKTALSTPKAATWLEDYILLFNLSTIKDFAVMPFETFRDILCKAIAPQMQIAANMGFSSGWKYTP